MNSSAAAAAAANIDGRVAATLYEQHFKLYARDLSEEASDDEGGSNSSSTRVFRAAAGGRSGKEEVDNTQVLERDYLLQRYIARVTLLAGLEPTFFAGALEQRVLNEATEVASNAIRELTGLDDIYREEFFFPDGKLYDYLTRYVGYLMKERVMVRAYQTALGPGGRGMTGKNMSVFRLRFLNLQALISRLDRRGDGTYYVNKNKRPRILE